MKNDNFQLHKSQTANVSVRYQLRENIATKKMMIPVSLTVSALVTIQALLYFVLLPKDPEIRSSEHQVSEYAVFSEMHVCHLAYSYSFNNFCFYRIL